MLKQLDSVAIAVRDLGSATSAYTRLLGRSPSWRGESPRAGIAQSLFRLDNATLELFAPAEGGTDSDAEGPVGLCFATDDAAACRAEWTRRGLEPGPLESGLARDSDSGAFRTWSRVVLPPRHSRGVELSAIEFTSPDAILPPAEPLSDPAGAAHGLDHAVVRTRDADGARALYGDALGLRVALDREFEQWGARLIFCRIGGLTVEIAAELGRGSEPSPARAQLWGLSYRVSNVDAARERLADAGLEVTEVRPGRKPGTRVFTVDSGTCGVATLMLEPMPPG